MCLLKILGSVICSAQIFLMWKSLRLSNLVPVIGIYGVTFLIILPLLCQDWVYSPLFQDDETKLMDYVKIATTLNDRRYYAAQLYFAELDANDELKTDSKPHSKDSAADIVYGVLSKSREPKTGPKFNLGYLTQTLAALHKATLGNHGLGGHKVIVCNIDEEPDKYREVSFIQDYAQLFHRYPYSKQSKPHQKVWRSNPDDEDGTYDAFEKQKDDMIFCMEKALEFSPRFVLILEDDTIVKDDFVSHVYHHLHTTIPAMHEKGIIETDNWAYIKLYYPDKWRGYSNTLCTVMELAGIFILGGSVAVFLLFTVQYVPVYIKGLRINFTPCFQCRTKTRALYIYFFLGGTYTVLLCYLIGRVYVNNTLLNWFPMYTRLESPSPGCCTQAVLYQARMLPKLVKFLKDQRCNIDYSHDLAIDQFSKQNGYLTFMVDPNLAVHVGMVSSVRAWAKNAAEYIYL